ncbi:MAG: M14 family zinc carboxypeptidase [Bacteroidetes bacterium]|nr:M14 family zinc carboxypeptidase [Bacteroidota bacterium]
MKQFLFTAFLLISTQGFAQETQEIYQRARISYSQIEDLSKLASLGIPVDHGVQKRGYFIISEFSVSELDLARQNGFQVDIIIGDAKAYFLSENKKNLPTRQFNPTCDGSGSTTYETPVNFSLGSMGGYLTYQELLDELDAMQTQFPNLITAKANISSFLTEGQPDNSTTPPIGGNGIKWVKISDNPNSSSEGEPQLLYTSIHHAREPASLSQLIFYMWYLLENYATNPEVQSIVDNTELYFVPVVNPDGYLYNEKTDPNGGGFWRKNRKNGNGVDNNRNYDYHINGDPNNGSWGGPGSSNNPNSQTYHGTGPFSEAENQAMKWFVEQHDFVMAFNNHTSGQILFYPFAYADVATPDDELFQGVSAELVSQNGYFALRDFPYAGESDDFMYGTVGTHNSIFSFTTEIGTSFWPASNQIESICKNMMYLNLTAAKMTNNYATLEDTAAQYIGDTSTGEATFDIKRLGVAGSGDFTISLNPVSSNITSTGSPVIFTGMQVLDEDSGNISYTLAAGTEAGDAIIYELVIDNGSYSTAITVNKYFGELISVFSDPGDSTTDNFDNNGWGTTSVTFVSPSSSITDSPGADYPNNTDETITISDAVDLTDALGANVTFYAKWEIENNWDYTQFEVSIDGGNIWIPQCGKYTNEGSTNAGQPTGEPLYDGFQNDWVLEEIDLSDYLGSTILVRFQLVSDGGLRADGFYFDDLTINIVEEGILSTNDLVNSQFVVYPNPVQDLLNITTPLENYTIELYTIHGQLVHRTENNNGSQMLDYSYLSSGIYLLRLTSAEVSQTLRIVKE